MDAFFSIPLFVSENNSGNVISIVSKCIETVNIVNYSGVFYDAAVKFIKMEEDKTMEKRKKEMEMESGRIRSSVFNKMMLLSEKARFYTEYSAKQNEDEKNIISFSPTLLRVNINKKTEERNDFLFGIKCVPIFVDNIVEVVEFIGDVIENNKYGKIMGFFRYLLNDSRLKNSKYGNIYRYIKKSYSFHGKMNSDVVFSLIKKNIYGSKNIWAEPPVLTYAVSVLSYEIAEKIKNTPKFLEKYPSLTKVGFGDFVIIDDIKESMIYCNHKTKVCDMKSFSDILPLFGKEEMLIGSSGSKTSFSPF